MEYLKVTILILIDGFLQYELLHYTITKKYVTILILIDGFLQFNCSTALLCPSALSQSLF